MGAILDKYNSCIHCLGPAVWRENLWAFGKMLATAYMCDSCDEVWLIRYAVQ